MARKKDSSDLKTAVFVLAVVAIGVVGTFFSGLVMGRSYKSAGEGFLKRLGVLFILIPCAGVNAFVFGLFSSLVELNTHCYGPVYIYSEDLDAKQQYENAVVDWMTRKNKAEQVQKDWDLVQAEREAKAQNPVNQLAGVLGFKKLNTEKNSAPRPVFNEPCPAYKPVGVGGTLKPDGLFELTDDHRLLVTQETFLGLCASLVIFLIGLVVGLVQRAGRRQQFAVEDKNRRFLSANNLLKKSSREFVDISSGQVYRVEARDGEKITLFPKGTRGKRAYIYIDETGQYTEFSGIIKVGIFESKTREDEVASSTNYGAAGRFTTGSI